MADKPDITPRFAAVDPTTLSAEVTEPTSGKKDVGWEEAEEPPHDYMNWVHAKTYQWLEYLKDGDFRGKHSIRQVDETTYTPLLEARDPATGAPRSNIDHNGFRMGQVTDFSEQWRTSGTTEPPGWTFSQAGSGSRVYGDPTADQPYRFASLLCGATDNSFAQLVSLPLTYYATDRTMVFEWFLRTGASVDVGAGMQYRGAVYFSNSGVWDRFVGFQMAPDTNTDIETFVVGSATHDQFDTSIAIAINTTYRLRIEVCGDTNHGGSNGLARFFINGALVRSFAGWTTPAADPIRLHHGLASGAPGNNYAVGIGPIRGGWNHIGTPDSL